MSLAAVMAAGIARAAESHTFASTWNAAGAEPLNVAGLPSKTSK